MTTDEQRRCELEQGLGHIGELISAKLTEAGIETKVEDVDLPLIPRMNALPSHYPMSVRPEGAPVVILEFFRCQVEDCVLSADDPSVLRIVSGVVQHYKRLRDAPGN
jgi:hypothetical protein